MNISYASQIQQDLEPIEASDLAIEPGEVRNLEVSDSFRYIHHCVCGLMHSRGFMYCQKRFYSQCDDQCTLVSYRVIPEKVV